jgi:hypothetical protein
MFDQTNVATATAVGLALYNFAKWYAAYREDARKREADFQAVVKSAKAKA